MTVRCSESTAPMTTVCTCVLGGMFVVVVVVVVVWVIELLVVSASAH